MDKDKLFELCGHLQVEIEREIEYQKSHEKDYSRYRKLMNELIDTCYEIEDSQAVSDWIEEKIIEYKKMMNS